MLSLIAFSSLCPVFSFLDSKFLKGRNNRHYSTYSVVSTVLTSLSALFTFIYLLYKSPTELMPYY